MKKNFNVIQIRGIKGLIIAIGVGICLAAGFILFPGYVCMYAWNFISSYVENMPAIGIIQGLLLWGIIVASYFVLKKDRVVVCFKTPEGLSEDELKAVFEDVKKQAKEDPVLQAMLKAREAELKLKNPEAQDNEQEVAETTESKS